MSAMRLAMMVQLKPDKVDEYRRNHKAVWPEVEARFRLVGIRELSLFLHESTVFMYVVYEGDVSFADALAHYADDPVIQRWEELNAECKLPASESSPNGFETIDEIYRFQDKSS